MDQAKPTYSIVHDHLVQRGGGERVVAAISRVLDADIHTSFFNPDATHPDVGERRVRPSWLNRITWFRSNHRWSFPILAPLFSMMRPASDITVMSTIGWAHFARPKGKRVAYWHAPARWLFQADVYLGKNAKGRAVRMLLPALRWLDQRAARTVDLHLANSTAVASRVSDLYGVPVRTIHPPVTFAGVPEPMNGIEPGYLLVVSRLLGYKNVDVIIAAMERLPGHRLVIAGTGPALPRLRRLASDRVIFTGDVSDDQLAWLYEHSAGLVTVAYEDFGLTPLEAAMFGTPCAALRSGGFLDTVIEGKTGVYIESLDTADVADAVLEMERTSWCSAELKAHAATFSEEAFSQQLHAALECLDAASNRAQAGF